MLGQDSKIAEFILLNLLNQRKFCIQLFSQEYIYLVQEYKNYQYLCVEQIIKVQNITSFQHDFYFVSVVDE